MPRKIDVSVIMPAYNAECYIEEAIHSVLAQRQVAFELLIMNDASTDHTLRSIRKFRSHPNIRLWNNRRRQGAANTRNRLVSHARGKYLVPCDADDLMLDGALLRFFCVLEKNPHFGAVYADIIILEMNRPVTPFVFGKDVNQEWDLLDNVVNHGGSMIRKNLFDQIGGYDSKLSAMEDWDLWLRLSEKTKIRYLKGEAYYVWRRSSMSLSRRTKHQQGLQRKILSQAFQRRSSLKKVSV